METKLYIKDDEYITLPLKRPTMQVKDALLKLNLEFTIEQKKIMQQEKFAGMSEIQEQLMAIEQGENKDLATALKLINNPETSVLIQEFTNATQKLADEYSLKKFKEVVDSSKIDDAEVKKQYDSAVTSSFWKNQDLTEVNSVLEYFRQQLKI